MAYRYLGSATTNSNGIAELNFTGHGLGELDIVASTSNPITGSSLVSETYELLDCLVYDDGVSDPKKTNFIKTGDATLNIGSNGTTLTATSNTTYRNTTLITGDFEITLQVNLISTVRIGVQTGADLGYKQTKFNYFDFEGYLKFRRIGTTYTAQYSPDGVTWNTRSLETNNVGDNDCYFIISLETTGTERTITYKDLKIYPI